MEAYFILKWLHILSAMVLLGTGLGTAFYMFAAYRTGDAHVLHAVARQVVVADWLFTGTSGVAQPVTGLLLAQEAGYPLTSGWLLAAFGLYGVALVCWLPVVALQICVRDLAGAAAQAGQALPPEVHRLMSIWFALGWPAFAALVATVYLMVARPF